MNHFKLLAEQSIVNGVQTLTEDQVRSMCGAPTIEEEELCSCGDPLDTCPDSYEHMTHGV